MTRDFHRLPDAALLRLDEFVAPNGPLPWRRSKFLELVQRRQAPQPVMRGHRMTVWRWGDLREFLESLANGEAA